MIQGSDSNFYGTTESGGPNGDGTLYKITPQGTETVLHLFGTSSGDGYHPQAGLIQASDGNFYGTTSDGGTNSSCENGAGCGTIFRFSPSSGTYTVLYSLGGFSGDGENPVAALIQGSDGNLYGTTSAGGASGNGTVFKFNPTAGTETVLYSFAGSPSDGQAPYAGVIQGSDGNLYGTTPAGGASGNGTVFEFNLTALTETVLYSFAGGPNDDGQAPYAGVIEGTDTNLYGTTVLGGPTNAGIIFLFSPASAAEKIIYNFEGYGGFAVDPSGLIQGSDGNFYGTTSAGGTNCLSSGSGGCGTIFMFSPSSGVYTVLHSFGSFSGDGENPTGAGPTGAGVIRTSDGTLYGTTGSGGTNGDGTVFEFEPQ